MELYSLSIVKLDAADMAQIIEVCLGIDRDKVIELGAVVGGNRVKFLAIKLLVVGEDVAVIFDRDASIEAIKEFLASTTHEIAMRAISRVRAE